MGIHVMKTCDICKKPTEMIVGKLFFTPIIPGVATTSSAHNLYTHYAHVGNCCKDKLLRLVAFNPRQTADQYQSRGKRRASK